MIEKFQKQLLDERNREKEIQESIRETQERLEKLQKELWECRGRISLCEEWLRPSNNGEAPLHVTTAGNVISSSEAMGTMLNEKRRAPRSTQSEMLKRRRILGNILLSGGDDSAQALLPKMTEQLGYELEPHHLRNVLYKYDKYFTSREGHGIWGLTEEGITYFQSLSDDDVDEETE